MIKSFARSYSKVVPTKLKSKKHSSYEWMSRQLSDPYVEKAKMLNYRCRSAFKLLEMDEKFKLLCPGDVIIDCGAAPGSWSQVAVSKCNSKGTVPKLPKGLVIGIDRLQIYPIEGATLIGNSDFTSSETQEKIKQVLDGKKATMMLSDMAPNATGIREMDNDNIVALCYAVLKFALEISCEEAGLVVKVWDGRAVPKFQQDLARFYKSVKNAKPASSRSDSAERFIIARGFKGLQ